MILVFAKGCLIVPAILPKNVDQELQRELIADLQLPSPDTKPTMVPSAWFVSSFP